MSITHIDVTEEGPFVDLLQKSDLLSLTEPVFFDELNIIFKDIFLNKIEGDILEGGVWKGATAIYMKALINTYQLDKKLWLIDCFGSFEDLDMNMYQKEKDKIAIKKFANWGVKSPSLEDVKYNFNRFNLWDENNIVIKGDIFKTFVECRAKSLSLLRLDLDFYESTYFMLEKLYEKVSIGGYVIIDDYGVEDFNCSEAVDKFRSENNITGELKRVGHFVAYWKKEK